MILEKCRHMVYDTLYITINCYMYVYVYVWSVCVCIRFGRNEVERPNGLVILKAIPTQWKIAGRWPTVMSTHPHCLWRRGWVESDSTQKNRQLPLRPWLSRVTCIISIATIMVNEAGYCSGRSSEGFLLSFLFCAVTRGAFYGRNVILTSLYCLRDADPGTALCSEAFFFFFLWKR